MIDLTLASDRSRLRLHTFAEGLFARLAHDLELTCAEVAGSAARDGAKGSASLSVPLSGIGVAGVLKDGRVDASVLSASDQRDVLEKMRREVFHASGDAAVKVEAEHDGASARVRVIPPKGPEVTSTVRPEVRDEDGGVRVSGKVEVSLSAIGSDVVKGPMGAFRVKDRVEVLFDLLFVPKS